MRIAVSANGREISDHFGHCREYHVFEVQDGKIINEEVHPNPGHAPGINPPTFVASLNVDVALGTTVAQHAVDIMNQAGVEVILGVSGDARQAAEDYIAGKLKNDPGAVKDCVNC